MAYIWYWKLDGNSTDYSGNSDNGTDTAITYVPWKNGQCASFNGSSSYISSSTTFPVTSTVTCSCWVYPTSFTSYGMIMTKWDNGTGNNGAYELRRETGSGTVGWLVNGNVVDVTGALTLNTWTYIVATYQASTLQAVYINWKLAASQTPNSNSTGSSTYNKNIGRRFDGYYWAGQIDEAILDNTAWSAQKIKTQYSLYRGIF